MPRLAALAALLAVMPLGAAHAEEPAPLSESDRAARAKTRFDEGQARFNHGEFEAAALEFEAAYQYRPLPILLWNIAQSYRKAGLAAKALDFYRQYQKAEPASKHRAEVAQHIAELDARPATRAPPPPDTVAPPAAAPPARAVPDDEERPPLARETNSLMPPPAFSTDTPAPVRSAPPPAWYRDVAGATLCSLGLVTAAVGAGLLGDALVTASNANQSYDRFKAAQGAGDERTAGAVLMVAGASVVAGGVVRYLLVRKRSRGASALVAPAPGGAVLVIAGTF